MENLKVNNFNQQKKLPSNIEAEQALIGSFLVNNKMNFHKELKIKIYDAF